MDGSACILQSRSPPCNKGWFKWAHFPTTSFCLSVFTYKSICSKCSFDSFSIHGTFAITKPDMDVFVAGMWKDKDLAAQQTKRNEAASSLRIPCKGSWTAKMTARSPAVLLWNGLRLTCTERIIFALASERESKEAFAANVLCANVPTCKRTWRTRIIIPSDGAENQRCDLNLSLRFICATVAIKRKNRRHKLTCGRDFLGLEPPILPGRIEPVSRYLQQNYYSEVRKNKFKINAF